MKKLLVALIIFSYYTTNSIGQRIDDCKVDLSIFKSRMNFLAEDSGKYYVLINNNLPEYLDHEDNLTEVEISNLMHEKIKFNTDYNNQNKNIEDSIFNYYNSKINKIGVELWYWEELRNASESEITELDKSISDVVISYNVKKYTKHIYKSNKFVTAGEYSDFMQLYNRQKKGIRLENEFNYYTVLEFFHVDYASVIDRYEFWKNNDLKLLFNKKVYILKKKIIDPNYPIFYFDNFPAQQPYVLYKFIALFPEQVPIFNLTDLLNKSLRFQPFIKTTYKESISRLSFFSNDKRISVLNYPFVDKSKDFENDIKKSKILFYDLKRIELIDNLLNSMKSKTYIVQKDFKYLTEARIKDFTFNISQFKVDFIDNQNYSFSNLYSNNIYQQLDSKFDNVYDIYCNLDISLYDKTCYDIALKNFNNLKLPRDTRDDPELKSKLLNSLSNSDMWNNYAIISVILTENSGWTTYRNKYTGLVTIRTLQASAYIKHKLSGKCYYVKQIDFEQANEIGKGFIHQISVTSRPLELEEYPCNLK